MNWKLVLRGDSRIQICGPLYVETKVFLKKYLMKEMRRSHLISVMTRSLGGSLLYAPAHLLIVFLCVVDSISMARCCSLTLTPTISRRNVAVCWISSADRQ